MTVQVRPKIEASWLEVLSEEFEQPYFAELKAFLLDEKRRYEVYPPGNCIFAAFDLTPFNQVKVVILGQDPYHGKGQAHGLAFSVPMGVPIPPSLLNIYKEINADCGLPIPSHGNLTFWAQQGVLLLNATLTVRANQAGSHQKRGWETFTDAAIKKLSELRTGIVFLLWGAYAQAKEPLIDRTKHFILKAPHPSPLSASRGFLGCGHFSKTNEILCSIGKSPINWSVNP
ncbi:MAG TPA: uracil-DNA glycosylase [Salinivirgaceae bacterium]|nr:uracil-DNA glycosylase [Salinivirgaceae bacterium]